MYPADNAAQQLTALAWHRSHRLHLSHVGWLPKPVTNPDTSGANYFCWINGGGGWRVQGQRFSSVNTADKVVYLASHNGCNYTPLQGQSAVPGWACENGSRITLKGSAGLSFLKHCGYRLVHRNDYRPPGYHVGLPSIDAFSSLLGRQLRRRGGGGEGTGGRSGRSSSLRTFTKHILCAGPRSIHCPYISSCLSNLIRPVHNIFFPLEIHLQYLNILRAIQSTNSY